MSALVDAVLGPRVSREIRARDPGRYRLPTLLFALAAVLLLVSIFLPYWKMRLEAPQYPKGLHVQAYVNRLEGDVAEIDGLNHYIGMRPLEDAAQLERSMSIASIAAISLLVLAAVAIHNRWAVLAVLPALAYPAVFLLDLWYWLHTFGQNLDPTAALSSSVKPFTPPVLGVGLVGQFRTVAWPGAGLILAACASVAVVVGLWAHRRAYKPLVDARRPGS